MSRRKQARPSRASLEDELLAVQGALRLNLATTAAVAAVVAETTANTRKCAVFYNPSETRE